MWCSQDYQTQQYETLKEDLEKLTTPKTKAETELVDCFTNLGVLEEVRQLTEQEIFLRGHRKKHEKE